MWGFEKLTLGGGGGSSLFVMALLVGERGEGPTREVQKQKEYVWDIDLYEMGKQIQKVGPTHL